MKTAILFLAFTFSGFGLSYGQSIGPSIINSTGGSAAAGGRLYDWSVGELVMVSTFYGNNVTVTQGVLQNEISIGVGIANANIGGMIEVFPNPSSNIVNLRFNAATKGAFSYRFLDMAGRVLLRNDGDINSGSNTQQLNIAEFAAATYMLEVVFKARGGNEEMASYKIQKLK